MSLLMKKMKPLYRRRRHWFEGFIKRHPEVGQRVAQNLTQIRALVKESDLKTWFNEIHEIIIAAGLQDPRRIFNCDESAFFVTNKKHY